MQLPQATGIISFGAGSQLGDVTIGEAAGRDLIKTFNTIVAPAAPPTIERHASAPLPPRPLRGFRDREREQGELLAELRPGGGAWLSGPGGAGISALLRQVASARGAALPEGVAYLDRGALLHDDGSGEGAAPGLDDVAQLLFERFYRSSDPTRRVRVDFSRARAYLQSLQALFIFDRLPLARQQVEQLIDGLAGGSVLVAAPGPPAETLLDMRLAGLPRADAAALLAAGAGADLADQAVAPHLATLCEALGDLPLGLELVGALLRSGVAPLERVAGAVASYASERSPLARALRLVLEALGVDERAALAACVAGDPDLAEDALLGITRLDATRLANATERLAELRLVVASEGRYGIVSLSARQELARLLDVREARRAAAAFFAGAALARPGDLAWAAREAGNLFASAAHAARHGTPGQIGPIARLLHPNVVLEGRWGAWGQLASWAGEAAGREGDDALRAWALHERGVQSLLSGAPAAGLAALGEALAIREGLGEAGAAELTRRAIALATPHSTPPPSRTRPSRWLAIPLLLLLLLAGGIGVAAVRPGQQAATPTALASATPPGVAQAPTPEPTPSAAPSPRPALAATTSAPTPQPDASATPTGAPPPTASATPAPTATADLTAEALVGRCAVIAPALNVREGPGPEYAIVGTLSAGTLITPLAQAYGGAWLEIAGPGSRDWAFNGANPPTLTCAVALADLPLGQIPPTRTATPSATATETPSATPSATATETATATASPSPSLTATAITAPTRRPRPTVEPATETALPIPATILPIPAPLPPTETPPPPTETPIIPG
jgi:hypothetical protein